MSFRREAYTPKGGPDGGDGGRGGDVVAVCDGSLRDLAAMRHHGHYKAERGGHGEGNQRHGADGKDLELRVPPGTVAISTDGSTYDLVEPGQRAVLAAGGPGGRGNKRFTSSTRQAPRFAERGLPGEEGEVKLNLKLLADVGLVGLPNAGKSSLLAALTRAKPKVANYPFTTLEPNLGTITADDRQIVIADIPGLIEGASTGLGLGHEFLAHIERTSVIAHVVDIAPVDGTDPQQSYELIENELAEYQPRLAALPRIVVLSKLDLIPPDELPEMVKSWQEHTGKPVIATSSATHLGLDQLAIDLVAAVPIDAPRAPMADQPAVAQHMVFRPAAGREWRVEHGDDGVYRVVGAPIERLLARFDIDDEDALRYVEHRLWRMGVIEALEEAGFESGDDLELGGREFDFAPE